MATVLVTGASTGFGEVTALHLARNGHTVVATMRTPERSPQLLEAAAAEELPLTVLQLDVTDQASVDAAMAAARSSVGPIDVLVSNAGIFTLKPIEETELEEFQAIMETNYLGSLRCIKALLPEMRERRSGTIVVVSSVAGRISAHSLGAYAASKHALGAASEALAQEVRPHGIQVRLIEPGIIATPMTERRRNRAPENTHYPAQYRWQAVFDQLVVDPPTSPLEVAEKIEEVMETESDQFRWLVGPTAEPFMGWRQSFTDEAWVEYNGLADDEPWYATFEGAFAMDIRPKPSGVGMWFEAWRATYPALKARMDSIPADG